VLHHLTFFWETVHALSRQGLASAEREFARAIEARFPQALEHIVRSERVVEAEFSVFSWRTFVLGFGSVVWSRLIVPSPLIRVRPRSSAAYCVSPVHVCGQRARLAGAATFDRSIPSDPRSSAFIRGEIVFFLDTIV
jgi:hypothetical protein